MLNGRGFLLLRGLPVERWTMRESATAFYGLGAHLGSARSQNGKGHVLGHVKDLGLASNDPNVRIYQTHERQTFHTDSCDIVGLLCLKTAKSGGLSALVSSTTIFNEMRRRRPDLLKLLVRARGHRPARRGAGGHRSPTSRSRCSTGTQGHLSAIYQRQYIDSAQRFPEAPRLTPAHVEALDMFDALTNDPELNMFMEFKPGDVQLVHNHTLLHDRTGFEDWAEPDEAPPPAAPVARRRQGAARCRRSMPSATAASRSATAAASSSAAPSSTPRSRRFRHRTADLQVRIMIHERTWRSAVQ